MDEYYYGSPARLSFSVTNLIAQLCGIVVLSTHCVFQMISMLSTVMQLFHTLFLFIITMAAKSMAPFVSFLRIDYHDITFTCLIIATSIQSMYWNLHCIHPLPPLLTALSSQFYFLLALFSLQVVMEFYLRHTIRTESLSKSSLVVMLFTSSVLIACLIALPPTLYMLCIAEPFLSSLVFSLFVLIIRDFDFITTNYYSLRLLPNVFIGYHIIRKSYHYIYALLLCYKIYIVCLAVIKFITSFIVKRAIHHNFSLPSQAPTDQCSICLNEHNRDSCKLPCGHCVHSGCLLNMFYSNASAKCPLCRRPVQLRLYYELLQAGNYHIIAFLIDMLLLFLFTPHIQYPSRTNAGSPPAPNLAGLPARHTVVIRLSSSRSPSATPVHIYPRQAASGSSNRQSTLRDASTRVSTSTLSPPASIPSAAPDYQNLHSRLSTNSTTISSNSTPSPLPSLSESSPPPSPSVAATSIAPAVTYKYNTRQKNKRKHDEPTPSSSTGARDTIASRKRRATKTATNTAKKSRKDKENT